MCRLPTGGSSIAAASRSDGAQTVAASATTVTPPAAALNLAMQVGDCLLSAGMSANDAVVAMLGITDAHGLTRVHVDVTYTSISASCYPARGGAALELAWRLGAPLSISPEPVALGPLGAQFVGATMISAFFALWAYADLATIGLAGAMGVLGWAGYASMIYIGSVSSRRRRG